MQMLIDSGRYKVTEVLSARIGFEAALCCDVTVNDGNTYIVDQYSSMTYIRELLPLFYTLEKKHFRGLRAIVTSSGSFSAVFVYHDGVPFGEYFSGRLPEYEKCLTLADSLLRSALEFDLADERTAACGLLESNAVVDEKNGQVHFNMLIDPDRTAGEGFRPRRLGGMLDRMFRRDRYFPEEIARLIDDMIAGKYPSCAAAYSAWRGIQPSAAKTREEYQKESFMKYLGRRIRAKRARRRRNRRGA